MWQGVLRVSTVLLGGEGKSGFSRIADFCNKFIGFANLKKKKKKLRIANRLKILARFSDCIYPEVCSVVESSIFGRLLSACWCFVDQFFSVSFISRSDYNQFLLEFLFDLRDHFLKENLLNNIYKHIR